MPATDTSDIGEMGMLITPMGTNVVAAMFLAQLPRFEKHAPYAFRRVACPQSRGDRVAEALAPAWKHFAALYLRGRNPEQVVTTRALRCPQAVRAGRRLTGSVCATDVLSPIAQVRHDFAVARLPERAAPPAPDSRPDEFADALADNTKSRVPDPVAVRLDFPQRRRTFGRRGRRVLDALMAGGGTDVVAAQFAISPARVSQLRRAFEHSWAAFHRG